MNKYAKKYYVIHEMRWPCNFHFRYVTDKILFTLQVYWVIFLWKKYLLVGASSMLWADGSVSQWKMYVFHTNQIGSTINSQSNFSL